MIKKYIVGCLLLLTISTTAQVLPLREQEKIINSLLEERLNFLLPALMDSTGIDMWIIVSREYNEDPVIKTMLPADWLSARRRTILVFYRNSKTGSFEKLAISRYDAGDQIKAAWDMNKFPDQWDALADLITTHKPFKIGINRSAFHGQADGIDLTDYEEMRKKLPAAYVAKLVSAEDLAIRWLETRTAREMMIYPQLIDITHRVIEEGFSEKVIHAGITSAEDLVWWFREKLRTLGLETWFHPSVSIQRNDAGSFDHLRSFSKQSRDEIILPGDLLHVDFGISYLRLNTDVQQHAYMLMPGETALPTALQKAFDNSSRLQDLLTGSFQVGKTGNQVLAETLAKAKKEGITASIYTHPLGYHGHAAGPTIGLWDQQQGVPGAGDYPIHANTVYSIELNTASEITEWKKTIRMMLEEDGFFDGRNFRFINGRQKTPWLIPRIQQDTRE
jgi:Xaa-Pro aminopeptidase